VIVLDEHLQEVGVAAAICRWYRGRICIVTALRPGTVVKDDSIPSLLQAVSEPTFVTLNWKHFWQRTAAHQGFCLVCLTLLPRQEAEVSVLLRRLFRLPPFQTKAARMGKVARISGDQVTYYQVRDSQTYVMALPA
jgi:hypothetical protein